MDSSGGGSEISLSIEETNKLRISLGLKPLKEENNKEKEAKQKQKRKEESKEAKSFLLKEKLKESKKNREYLSQISGKSLGEELAEEDEGAAAWVAKSRILQETDKQLAERRARTLADQDAEFETDDAYSSKDLKGIKIGHKLENFLAESGEQVILTFEDTRILKDADTLNDEEAQLINPNIREKEIANRNQDRRKKKPVYDAYSDEKKELLPQYNAPKEQETFMLDDEGIVDMEVKAKNEWLQSRKEIAGKSLYSLDTEKIGMTEFYTKQEMVKFKNPGQKKKKKIRTKEKLELEPLSDQTTKADLGSRSESTKLKLDQIREEDQKVKNKKGYARALEKAKEETQILFEDEDDTTLSNTLTNVRELSTKKKVQAANLSAKFEEKLKNRQHKGEVKLQDPSLLFTATTEFVRGIQNTFDERITKSKSKKIKEESMEIDIPIIEEDVTEHERMIQQEAEKERKRRQKEERKKQKEEEKIRAEEESHGNNSAVLDSAEPLVSGGIAATLSLLKSKSVNHEPLDSVVGRKNDKLKDVDKRDPAPKVRLDYLDEYGRQLTPKEAFRQMSHKFHGKKPGKNKQEKRIKQQKEEIKRKGMDAGDTPNMTVHAMRMEQEKTQQPFILLSGASSSLYADVDPPTIPLSKPQVEKTSAKEGDFQSFAFVKQPPVKKQKKN